MMASSSKGSVGLELLVPLFLMVFAIVVIYTGIEWGVNNMVLMEQEKQINQMDTELLSINDLYISPSLRFSSQAVTRDLSENGGLSSDIIANKKLFSRIDYLHDDSMESDIESDFESGDMDFPSVESHIKVVGDYFYWSYVDSVDKTYETIPYRYDEIDYSLDGSDGRKAIVGPYTVLLTDMDGSVTVEYDDGTEEIITGPSVISGYQDVHIDTGDSSVRVLGAQDIDSDIKPLFPDISYTGDAYEQRYDFPLFADSMMDSNLNSYRSDYGSSNADIGSDLSLGTWKGYLVPTDSKDETISFYGGNRLVHRTEEIEMKNSDPVMSSDPNRYWYLYDIANEMYGEFRDDDFLYEDLTIDAHYTRDMIGGADIFRDVTTKTCDYEWGSVGISCSDAEDENTDCPVSHDPGETPYIEEMAIRPSKPKMGEMVDVSFTIECETGQDVVWRVSYNSGDPDDFEEFHESGTFTCGGLDSISIIDSSKYEETVSFSVATTLDVQDIRASVGLASDNSVDDVCMDGDNDDMTFEILDSSSRGTYYAQSTKDRCFDGDVGCMVKTECSDDYSKEKTISSDHNMIRLKGDDKSYVSENAQFDFVTEFNEDFKDGYIDDGQIPFIFKDMDASEIADHVASAQDITFTFDYGSDTTIACGEREDIISDMRLYLVGSDLSVSTNPDLEGTSHDKVFKTHSIDITDMKDEMASMIRSDGRISLKLDIETLSKGENLPDAMYPESHNRIYMYDNYEYGDIPRNYIDMPSKDHENTKSKSGGYGFIESYGMATDSEGNVYVIDGDDPDDPLLYRYNRHGVFTGYMDILAESPRGVDVDTGTGNIYISYLDSDKVVRYTNFFDTREFIQDPGSPSYPTEIDGVIGDALDIAFYDGNLFAATDDNRLYYHIYGDDRWGKLGLKGISGNHKIHRVSVDQESSTLYLKILKPTDDGIYDVEYMEYDLSSWPEDLASIEPSDEESFSVGFTIDYFDIYSPSETGNKKVYMLKRTKDKHDVHALLDDLKLDIGFKDLKIEAESFHAVENLTDRIEYYDDGCGNAHEKDSCPSLWKDYALNEHFRETSIFNHSNSYDDCIDLNYSIDRNTKDILKAYGLNTLNDAITCDHTIDDAAIDQYPSAYLEHKIEDKIIGPRIEAKIREFNDKYNDEGIYIQADYVIDSDFGINWDDDGYFKSIRKDHESKKTGYACRCKGRSKSCGHGDGNREYIYKTETFCEYVYGSIFRINITIEDSKVKVWDPVTHKMISQRFKYGVEGSVYDGNIDYRYIADERGGWSSAISGVPVYCSSHSPIGSCHVQSILEDNRDIPDYEDKEDDPGDCPEYAGSSVTYNELHCENDDYDKCSSPIKTKKVDCGEDCTKTITYRTYSCYRYDDCSSKWDNAKDDVTYYKTCDTEIKFDPPEPPKDNNETEDELIEFDITSLISNKCQTTDPCIMGLDVSSIDNDDKVKSDWSPNPSLPPSYSPSDNICERSVSSGYLEISVNNTYEGKLFVEDC